MIKPMQFHCPKSWQSNVMLPRMCQLSPYVWKNNTKFTTGEIGIQFIWIISPRSHNTDFQNWTKLFSAPIAVDRDFICANLTSHVGESTYFTFHSINFCHVHNISKMVQHCPAFRSSEQIHCNHSSHTPANRLSFRHAK